MVKRIILAGLTASFVLLLLVPPAHSSDYTGLGLHGDIFLTGSELNRQPSFRATAGEPLSPEARELKKRRGQAFLKSLALPGWGQLSEGRNTRGYIFIAAEATLVGSLISFITYKGWLEDDYRAFAQQHAGITGSKAHAYYVDIGNWMNVDEYNQQRLRFRQFDSMYTFPEDAWEWDSDYNRELFKDTRVNADRAGQMAMLMVGGLLINHLLSAVDAS